MSHSTFNTAVIKIGTEVVTTPDGALNERMIAHLVRQVRRVKEKIERVILVTSGAVASGRAKYQRKKHSGERTTEKQMYATGGQVRLMSLYEQYVEQQKDCIAHQLLVTRDNFSSGERQEQILGVLGEIFADEIDGLPIFNENDGIANEEIRFTDNDELAGMITSLVRSDVFVLLSDVDGVMKDYGTDHASLIARIAPEQQDAYRKYIVPVTSKKGTGGMESKYKVACNAANNGMQAHIANGRTPGILEKILLDREKGVSTMFSTR